MSDVFFKKDELLNCLSEKELNDLFISYKNGNFEARQKIIEHNLYLVQYCIDHYFNDIKHDKIGLFEYGIFGLIYSVDHYDVDYGTQFSRYAITSINRMINHLLRDEAKFSKEISLDSNLDIISNMEDYDANFTEQYFDLCSIEDIKEGIGYLNEKEQEVINLYFGLNGNKKHTIIEIGELFGISKQYVDVMIKNSLRKIRSHVNACDEIKFNKRNNI